MKVAALDLGTNTFLCLIAEVDSSGIREVYKDLSQVVRLGQGVDKSGEFHPEALRRAKDCLAEFKKEIDNHKVDQILAMATSAARDAKNGAELFEIGRELGIPMKIISGDDEARITYMGATVGLQGKNKVTLVVDVGGGSTEFIIGKGQQIQFGISLNLGGVRLTDRFIKNQPVSPKERSDLNSFIQAETKDLIARLSKENIEEVIAVAGTPTSLAALEVGGFDEKKVDGFFLPEERLRYWVEEFARTTVEEKKARYQLGGRADIIFAGATILLSVIEGLHLKGMTVTTKGVRYGVALEMAK